MNSMNTPKPKKLARYISIIESELGNDETKGNVYVNIDRLERRIDQMNQQDHDLLIEIKNDVKHLVGTFAIHIEDDAKSFKEVIRDIDFQKKITYGCIGAFVLLEIVLKLTK